MEFRTFRSLAVHWMSYLRIPFYQYILTRMLKTRIWKLYEKWVTKKNAYYYQAIPDKLSISPKKKDAWKTALDFRSCSLIGIVNVAKNKQWSKKHRFPYWFAITRATGSKKILSPWSLFFTDKGINFQYFTHALSSKVSKTRSTSDCCEILHASSWDFYPFIFKSLYSQTNEQTTIARQK